MNMDCTIGARQYFISFDELADSATAVQGLDRIPPHL
jgi:hypothetical protein